MGSATALGGTKWGYSIGVQISPAGGALRVRVVSAACPFCGSRNTPLIRTSLVGVCPLGGVLCTPLWGSCSPLSVLLLSPVHPEWSAPCAPEVATRPARSLRSRAGLPQGAPQARPAPSACASPAPPTPPAGARGAQRCARCAHKEGAPHQGAPSALVGRRPLYFTIR